jgi:hypothetical protein
MSRTFLRNLNCVILACFFWGCTRESVQSSEKAEKSFDTNAVLQICTKTMRIQFPSSVKIINYRRILGFQDNYDILLIEVIPSKLNDLLNNSPFKGNIFRSDRSLLLPLDDVEWWKPRKVKIFLSSQVYLNNGEYLNILIDKDKKDVYYVYLEWGQT